MQMLHIAHIPCLTSRMLVFNDSKSACINNSSRRDLHILTPKSGGEATVGARMGCTRRGTSCSCLWLHPSVWRCSLLSNTDAQTHAEHWHTCHRFPEIANLHSHQQSLRSCSEMKAKGYRRSRSATDDQDLLSQDLVHKASTTAKPTPHRRGWNVIVYIAASLLTFVPFSTSVSCSHTSDPDLTPVA